MPGVRGWTLLLVLLPVLAAGPSRSQVLLAPGSGAEPVALSGHLFLLLDESASFGIDEVRQSDAFRPLPGDLNAGFTGAAAWLRVDVERAAGPAGAAVQSRWLLEVGNPLLDDVRLWAPTALTAPTAPGAPAPLVEQRSGEDVPRRTWTFDYPRPVFRIDLPPGPSRLFLRLKARNALSTGVRLWTPERFEVRARLESLAYGAYFGAYLSILVFQFFFWAWTREPIGGWYAAYVALNFTGAFLTVGYPQQLLGLSGRLSDTLLGTAICLVIGVGTTFSSRQLELDRLFPRSTRACLNAAWVFTAVTAALVLSGSYGSGTAAAQGASVVVIGVLLLVASWLLARGHRPARLFLLAFGVFYAGVVLRYLCNLGVLRSGEVGDLGMQAGSLLHMAIMSLGITGRYNTLKREKAEAQAETIAATRQLATTLEARVAERTAELTVEIEHRGELEKELRRALEVEQIARRDQREFVAMVSHEFRTPLTVIDTSVQQLESSPDPPAERTVRRYRNITGATRRMTSLMDEYLTFDRLDGDSVPVHLVPCDPGRIVERAVADFSPGRIAVEIRSLPRSFSCDPDLAHVALRNLLENAEKHSPEDRPVTLCVRASDGGGLELTVTDRGEGVPPDEMPRLFEKYFRGRGARGRPGAGLGLYLVDRIARIHGGAVSAESVPGEGTTVRISLPGS